MEATTGKHTAAVVPRLRVRYTGDLSYDTGMDAVSSLLDGEEKVSVAYAPWPAFPYKPDTRVSILYSDHCLFLKFYVEEKTLLAVHADTHSAVYKDSCVEFFISLDDSGYYNLEFNSIGTCLAAFGMDKDNRTFLPIEAVERIRRRAVIDREPNRGVVRWTLTLVVPFETLVHHQPFALHARECRANFYKCGDDLPEPHFLSWAPLKAPQPDFHQPQDFGILYFE